MPDEIDEVEYAIDGESVPLVNLLKETGIGECNNLDFLTITFSTLSEITCLNKLDVSTFINIFPDLLIVLNTSVLGFASVPGIGMRKAQHITSLVQNAFH